MGKRFVSVKEFVEDMRDDAPEFVEEMIKIIDDHQVIDLLVSHRCAMGLTQSNVASRMNCSQSRVSKIEMYNDKNLKLKDVIDYASAIGCSVNIQIAKKH